MQSISGLPSAVSGAPEMAFTAPAVTEPAPTAARVLDGTLVTCRVTLAGRTVPAAGPAGAAGLLWLALTRTNATTIATTTTMAPPAAASRLRRSLRRAAAHCAAIRSLALRCCSRAGLLIRAAFPASAGPGCPLLSERSQTALPGSSVLVFWLNVTGGPTAAICLHATARHHGRPPRSCRVGTLSGTDPSRRPTITLEGLRQGKPARVRVPLPGGGSGRSMGPGSRRCYGLPG